MKTGLIHIYTGEGKGKTTAACGLALRAAGQTMRVLFVQFLKSGNSGELHSLKRLNGVTVLCGNPIQKFVWDMSPQEQELAKQECTKLLEQAHVLSKVYDMLILDEIFGAIQNGMIEKQSVVSLMQNKPEHIELVLTGRNPDEEILSLADYVSEIKMIKHPFEQGISARKGIEF